MADRTIQKWRRRGWIAFEREGRKIIWRLTDTGRRSLTVGGKSIPAEQRT